MSTPVAKPWVVTAPRRTRRGRIVVVRRFEHEIEARIYRDRRSRDTGDTYSHEYRPEGGDNIDLAELTRG